MNAYINFSFFTPSILKRLYFLLIIISYNKIKKLIESELKDYEHYKKESEKMLKKYKGEVLEASIMAKTMAKMKLNFDIMKDNSDSKIADILTRGFTMGTIDMNKKIDEYKKSADKNVLKLAKEFLEFQNKNIELLKEYL